MGSAAGSIMITVNSPNLLSPLDLCSSSMGTRDGRRACSPRTPHLYGGPITSSRPDPPLAQAQPSPRACSQSAVCPCEVHWQLPSSRCGHAPQRRPTGENPWRGRHERGAARTGQEMRASLYEARGGHAARAACEGHPHQGILTGERPAKTSLGAAQANGAVAGREPTGRRRPRERRRAC